MAEPLVSEIPQLPAQLMQSARMAAARCAATPIAVRVGWLHSLREVLAARSDAIAKTLAAGTGKSPTESLLNELFPVLESLKYYEKNLAQLLRVRQVHRLFSFPYAQGFVGYRPFGVVAVFGPSNYPFQLVLLPALTAVAGGNAVVAKISPTAPMVGPLIEALCRDAGWPGDLLTTLGGDAANGRALIDARPDKIFFTGSSAVGRQILHQAADALIPVELELGGNDAAIVFEDAPFERTLQGVLYGAFANSGQVCVATRRLFVQQPLYERFISALRAEANRLRPVVGSEGELSPPLSTAGPATLQDHVRDAAQKGARVFPADAPPDSRWRPTMILDATSTMRVMTEETFGPLIACQPFTTEAEAIALANAGPFGLSGSVWTADLSRGRRVAAALETGSSAVNDVLKNVGHPLLPFGGAKQSGFGRSHGPEGLYAFVQTQSILLNKGVLKKEVNWFPYTSAHYTRLWEFTQFLFGGGPLARRLWRFRNTLRYFRAFFKTHAH